MKTKHWITIAAAIALAAVLFFAMPGSAPPPESVNVAQMAQEASRAFPGSEVAITYTETEAASTDSRSGNTAVGESKKSFWRGVSWFGLGATEAAVQDKGIVANGTSLGRSEGYGVLERFWAWLKGVFWFGAFGLLGLLVLTLIPATSAIASTILRAIASIVPVLGSVVERVFSVVKFEIPAKQIIMGSEGFKAEIKVEQFVEDPVLNAKIIARILEKFRAAQNAAQGDRARKTVEQMQ